MQHEDTLRTLTAQFKEKNDALLEQVQLMSEAKNQLEAELKQVRDYAHRLRNEYNYARNQDSLSLRSSIRKVEIVCGVGKEDLGNFDSETDQGKLYHQLRQVSTTVTQLAVSFSKSHGLRLIGPLLKGLSGFWTFSTF